MGIWNYDDEGNPVSQSGGDANSATDEPIQLLPYDGTSYQVLNATPGIGGRIICVVTRGRDGLHEVIEAHSDAQFRELYQRLNRECRLMGAKWYAATKHQIERLRTIRP